MLHVVESDTQHLAAPLQLGGALLDDLFQPDGCVGAFREQLIQLDGVSPKYFDGSSHGAHFVGPRHRNRAFASARRNSHHRAAQMREAMHDVASDVQPGNQACGDKGHDRERDEKNLTRANFLGGAGGNGLGTLALLLDKAVDRLLEFQGLGLRCHECKLCLTLSTQFTRTQSDDPALIR